MEAKKDLPEIDMKVLLFDLNNKIDLLNFRLDENLILLRNHAEALANGVMEKLGEHIESSNKKIEDLVGSLEMVKASAEAIHDGALTPQIDERIEAMTTVLRETVDSLGRRVLFLGDRINDAIDAPATESRRVQADMEYLFHQQKESEANMAKISKESEALEKAITSRVEELAKNNLTILEQAKSEILEQTRSNINNWYHENTMGEETAMGYSLMKELYGKDRDSKKKKNRDTKKKRSKKSSSHHGDDPDSSESSSSNSSDDEPRKRRKSRGKESSSDSDSSDDHHRRSRSRSNPLKSKRFSSGKRRVSIIGGDDSSSSDSDRRGKHSGRSTVYVHAAPSIQTLQLSAVTIGQVLRFCKDFNREASKFNGRLYAANYIEETVLSEMRQEAIKHDLPGQDGILSHAKQRISNKEVFAILAVMCAPKTLSEMQRVLATSAWRKGRHDYKTVDVIEKNIKDYRIDTLIYVDRFEDKLRLLGYHKSSEKFLPTTLFKKGGGDPGLADYFIGGMPEKKFGLNVWLSVDQEKRKKCQTWNEFIELYKRALEKIEERQRDQNINRQIFLGVKEMVKLEQTQRSERFKAKSPQRVHNMEDEGATVLADDDLASDEEVEVVFRKEGDDELPSPIDLSEDMEGEDDDLSDAPIQVSRREMSLLASSFQPANQEEKGVCYGMLFEGKCNRPACVYSHKEEDLAKARKLRAAKLLTPNNQPRSQSKQVSFRRTPAEAQKKK